MSEREEPALTISESASLERGYRRLLAWYPTWFRQENEEEVLAVLMACAQDDQTRPSREATFDLLKGAARMRLRPRPGQPRAVFAAVRLLCFGALAELGCRVHDRRDGGERQVDRGPQLSGLGAVRSDCTSSRRGARADRDRRVALAGPGESAGGATRPGSAWRRSSA